MAGEEKTSQQSASEREGLEGAGRGEQPTLPLGKEGAHGLGPLFSGASQLGSPRPGRGLGWAPLVLPTSRLCRPPATHFSLYFAPHRPKLLLVLFLFTVRFRRKRKGPNPLCPCAPSSLCKEGPWKLLRSKSCI